MPYHGVRGSEPEYPDLEQAAAVEGSTIHCLVEYEVGMGRCGVTTP